MSTPLDSRAAFVTTQWSIVLAAGETSSPESQQALEELCRAYWFPLYAYLRRRGHSSQDAQDLVQDFLAHLVARRAFAGVSPDRGRFRSYLSACLNHFVADAADRERAQKRGGGGVLLSLDAGHADQLYQLEARNELSAAQLFDRRWAVAVMDRALERLRAEQVASGKEAVFGRLRPFLTDTAEPGDYEPVAAQLGQTPNAVAVAVNRLRCRYRELVRVEVAATVGDPAQIDLEMQHLLAAMRGKSA